MHAPEPYTRALQDLQVKYGQPRQLVQSDLSSILTSPPIKYGDAEAFDNFSLSVHSLVGMLKTLEGPNEYKLKYGSHVDRLLSKMPASYRDSFVEYCLTRGILQTSTDKTYALPDLAAGLHMKSQAKRIASRAADLYPESAPNPRKKEQSTTTRFKEKTTTIYLNKNQGLIARIVTQRITSSALAPNTKLSLLTRRCSRSRSTNGAGDVHMLMYRILAP